MFQPKGELLYKNRMEVFLPITGFEGYYVSNTGKIKSCRKRNEVIMTPQLSREGYLCQNLWDGVSYHKKTIHRLIAEAFLPNPDNLPEVDHIDRDKSNNDISNLRWASISQNRINRTSKVGSTGERHIRCFANKPKPYGVTITRNRQTIFCKYFETLEEAVQARDSFLASF